MNPLIKRLDELTKGRRTDVAYDAGLGKNALTQWITNGVSPSLISFEAALNVVGYELKIVKKDEENEPDKS